MERFSVAPVEGGLRLMMTPVLDMMVAIPLLDAMRTAVAQGGNVEIDASQVDRLSTACVQILLATGRALGDRGRLFSIAKYSDAFIAAFGDLGLYPSLMEWLTE